jgi:SCY1-like protein 1
MQKPGPLRGRNPVAELIAHQFFQQHPAVHMMSFLSSLHIRSDEEKEAFFEALPTTMDRVPQTQQTRQVLPMLLDAQKFPGQEAAQVLPAILKIGTRLNEEEFKEKVAPLVVKLFVSPDRAIRFRLLMSIGDMIGNLDDAMINDKIFPECVNGFTDSSGPIREATVKALIHFVPRLKAKTVEGRVVKLLLKLSQDPEASIRTNAVICCGRISGHLPKATAVQTLGQGLQAGLKDPFGPCRSASLHTLLATCALFSMEELANRLLPQVCLRLVDPDNAVSDNAFEVLSALQKHLRTQMDERRAAQQIEPSAVQAPDAAGGSAAGGTWGSWALTTVGSALSSKLMGSMSSKPSADNLPSVGNTAPASGSPSATNAPSDTGKTAAAPGSGMSLGSTAKATTSNASLDLDDGGGAAAGAWGDDDFWDDFDAPAAPAAPSAKAKTTAPAAAADLNKNRANSAPAKANVVADEDDFWKEFDM